MRKKLCRASGCVGPGPWSNQSVRLGVWRLEEMAFWGLGPKGCWGDVTHKAVPEVQHDHTATKSPGLCPSTLIPSGSSLATLRLFSQDHGLESFFRLRLEKEPLGSGSDPCSAPERLEHRHQHSVLILYTSLATRPRSNTNPDLSRSQPHPW